MRLSHTLIFRLLIPLVFIIMGVNAFSQNSKAYVISMATVNARDIVSIKTQRSLTEQFEEIFNEPELESKHPRQPATDHIHRYKGLQATQSTGQPSPAAITGFAAKAFDGYYPPDPHGAVSENYVVSTVNNELYTQHRNGTLISDVQLSNFWAPVHQTTRLFDPRLLYDPTTQRWILVTDANSGSDSSCLLIALSQSDDPTAVWNLYKIKADAAGTSWADYPTIGFNQTWITITTNIFALTADNTDSGRIYVFNKAAMMNGLIPEVKTFDVEQGVSPAAMYDSTVSAMYYLQSYNGASGQLQLLKVSGPVGSEVLTSMGYPAIDMPWSAAPDSGADFAPQLNTSHKIQCNDDRMGSVLCKNKLLWCTHTVFLPATGEPSRSSVVWYAIDTTAEIIQHGLIDDPTGQTFYAFPSIAVNQYNDALIGYAMFSANMYAGAGYSYHDHAQYPGAVNDPHLFVSGLNTYYRSGSDRNRWGDCSATVTDPANDIDFWTINEYAESTASDWGSWWAYVPGLDTIDHNPAVTPFSVTLTPNPNNGVLNFYFAGPVTTPVGIDIYDVLGQHVYTATAIPDLNSIPVSIPHKLQEGIYIVRLHVNGEVIDQKMVVHY